MRDTRFNTKLVNLLDEFLSDAEMRALLEAGHGQVEAGIKCLARQALATLIAAGGET